MDKIPGGKADKLTQKFPTDQIVKGQEIESEHTDDQSVATEITLDHLTEDPHYYTKLQKMERSSSRRKRVARRVMAKRSEVGLEMQVDEVPFDGELREVVYWVDAVVEEDESGDETTPNDTPQIHDVVVEVQKVDGQKPTPDESETAKRWFSDKVEDSDKFRELILENI